MPRARAQPRTCPASTRAACRSPVSRARRASSSCWDRTYGTAPARWRSSAARSRICLGLLGVAVLARA